MAAESRANTVLSSVAIPSGEDGDTCASFCGQHYHQENRHTAFSNQALRKFNLHVGVAPALSGANWQETVEVIYLPIELNPLPSILRKQNMSSRRRATG